jgi:hypothetical protein
MPAYFNEHEHPRSATGRFIHSIHHKARVDMDFEQSPSASSSREKLQRLLHDGSTIEVQPIYISPSGRQRLLLFRADVGGEERNLSAEIASVLGEQVEVKSGFECILLNSSDPAAGQLVVRELSRCLGKMLQCSPLDMDGYPIPTTSTHGRHLPFL